MSVSGAPHEVRAVDRTGYVIGKRYRLLSQLDRGGQGVVYRALDLKHGDEVAIKIMSDCIAHDAESRERMFREAHALTVLTGTAAVRIFQQLWSEDGALCLVMELLHGRDLDDHLKAIEASERRLRVPDLVPIIAPVVDTLESAHAVGILHRDIKPGNIFVTNDGGVRVLDFGFAKFMRMRALTASGFIAGSPSYIAPEAWRGGEVDQRIDVYALAAVIFRALAGRPPFHADDLRDVLVQVTTAARPSLHALRPDLPAEVDDWVRQALAIEPSDRFLRVRAMWNALKAL